MNTATCWLGFCCLVSGALLGWAMRDIAMSPAPAGYTTVESFRSGDAEYAAAFTAEPQSAEMSWPSNGKFPAAPGTMPGGYKCYMGSVTDGSGVQMWKSRADGICYTEDAP